MPEIEADEQVATESACIEVLPADEDMEMLSRLVWGEARGCTAPEQAAVVWCVLNRCDDERFPDTIREVVTQRGQFIGYSPSHPIDEDIYELCVEVWNCYCMEQNGEEITRELPREYVFFSSDGRGHNVFRDSYKGGQKLWVS